MHPINFQNLLFEKIYLTYSSSLPFDSKYAHGTLHQSSPTDHDNPLETTKSYDTIMDTYILHLSHPQPTLPKINYNRIHVV